MQTVNNGRIYGISGSNVDTKRSVDDFGLATRGTRGKQNKDLSEKGCKAKLLKLVSMRDYSVASMRDKLAAAGFEDNVIENTIKFACEKGFLNDKRYAQNFIVSKQELGWGKGRIEKSLSEKGIDCSELAGYPDAFFSESDEVARALKCVCSHHTGAKKARDAHYRYLLSKGYSPSVASRALREFMKEN